MSAQELIVILIISCTGTVSGLKCLSCQDITHPRFCTQLFTCGTGEACGIEKFISYGGDTRYSLDCVANEVCKDHGSNKTIRAIHSAGGIRQCLQCCNSDLCNSGGCGEAGFRELGRTVCHNCQYQSDQHQCTMIETCNTDEICYIQEIRQYAEKYFHSGCRKKALCDALYNPGPAIGRRKRDDLCAQCCNGSLCNSRCTKDSCVDKPECSSLMSHYNVCQDSQTASYMCPKSCGMCHEATPPSSIPTCVDKSSNCGYLHSRLGICNDSAIVDQLGCQQTCGTCEDQTTNPPSSTVPRRSLTDTSGTEFYFAFTSNDRNKAFLTLYIISEGIGYVNLSIPFTTLHDTVHINSNLVIYNISDSLIPTPLVIEEKGIHVVSSVPVYLFVMNEYYDGSSSDAFNVLPAQQLARHYLIPTSEPYKQQDFTVSQVSVTSTTDRNNVTFTLVGSGQVTYNGKTFMNGDSLSVVLNKMETFELKHNYDLSGTKIIATEPIAVVSGNTCNHFNHGCSHLSDMVPLIDTYDTTFVIPKFPTQCVKILLIAGKSNTSVNVTTGSVITKYLRHAGDSVVMNINQTTAVSATKGVLATQFIYGDRVEPSMMIVPGTGQYLSNYRFVVPYSHSAEPFDNYITMVIRSSAVNGLFLDGNRLGYVQINSLQIAGVSYDYFRMSITPGYHDMYHDHDVTFGLFVFGKRIYDSYAFAAGKHLVNHMK